MPEKAIKRKIGRPTKYYPALCDEITEYFDQPPTIPVDIPHYDKQGNLTWTDKKEKPARIPSLTKFAKLKNIAWSTIHRWIDPNQGEFRAEFRDAYAHARAIRQDFLCDSAVQGQIAPNTFKFIAVNLTDMRDKQEVEHTSKDSIAALIQMASQEQIRIKQVESKEIPLLAPVKVDCDIDVALINGTKEHTQ